MKIKVKKIKWLIYLPHFVLLGMGIFGIYSVAYQNTGRWVAGVFGMYTSPHHEKRKIRVLAESEMNGEVKKESFILNRKEVPRGVYKSLRTHKSVPLLRSKETIRALIKKINMFNDKKIKKVQVWEPDFKFLNHNATWKLIHEISYTH